MNLSIVEHRRRTATSTPPATDEVTGEVLVVDDHASARQSMADILRHIGCPVVCCSSVAEALLTLADRPIDCILTDLQMPGMSGLDFLRELEHRQLDVPTVMITAHASIGTAVEAMRHGAFDYLEKPIRLEQLEDVVRRALQQAAVDSGRSRVPEAGEIPTAMIGSSPAMQRLRQQIARVAPTAETVLICGESGVGKELVARAVHAASRRNRSALVSVNCPALSPQLMESELFGHSRGAFTSAESARIGRFELADGGTLLLDEVTEIELPLQAKLLRVLQERTFERVGSSESQTVDARVLATTNRDLREYVQAGRFREDLYFRLAVVPLHVPTLRDRLEDVPELATHFLAKTATRLNAPAAELTADAIELLSQYHWPGNVRELENLMTRVSVLAAGPRIDADDLQPWLLDSEGNTTTSDDHPAASPVVPLSAGENLQDMERKLIEATLDRFDGHRGKTAQALGIGVRTLANKLRSYGYGPRAKIGKSA